MSEEQECFAVLVAGAEMANLTREDIGAILTALELADEGPRDIDYRMAEFKIRQACGLPLRQVDAG